MQVMPKEKMNCMHSLHSHSKKKKSFPKTKPQKENKRENKKEKRKTERKKLLQETTFSLLLNGKNECQEERIRNNKNNECQE
jgi:hypothetical protein